MRKSYSRLSRYISREFMKNFIVSFIFFFCIFFINSILLLVQKILLKNIDLATMIQMVALSMPFICKIQISSRNLNISTNWRMNLMPRRKALRKWHE